MSQKNKGKSQQQQKREVQPPVVLSGTVKAVHSGDSLVIVNQQGAEKEILINYIRAPKIARNDNQVDEDWAFASREFLRKLVIGKPVKFTIDYKTEQGREYASVFLGDGNIAKDIVANGWASVKLPDEGKKARNDLHQELIDFYLAAERDEKGIFQKPNASSVRNFKVVDQSRLFDEIKGTHDAIIEYVRDGTTFRVILLPSMHRVYIKISGAQAPQIPNPKSGEIAPPYAVEARNFVERHLLHRDVSVTVRSPGDKDGEFYGTVGFIGTDVAEELIKNGFASYVNWNAPQNKQTLQDLEAAAKEKKLRIWKSLPSSNNNNNNSNNNNNAAKSKNEIHGKIREIRDGGNFTIVDNSVTPPIKAQITLSSIQVPRFGVKDRDDEPYGFEAKEFIRKQFIGKKVIATLDFVRAAVKGQAGKSDLPEKEFWSVHCNEINLAVSLVENGLAKVIRGNQKDGRSPSFEQLVIAEQSAQSSHKNLWNKNKLPPVHNYSDLTQQDRDSKNRAKQFLPFFQRSPDQKVNAVVDYVLSPTRVKLFVPKENCLIVLGFEAVRFPKESPVYEESLEYVRDKLLQRDVQITVNSLDKNGSFIGCLFIQKKNFAINLLDLGYAIVSDAVEYSSSPQDYRDAEDRAKLAKKKHWTNYVHVEPVVDEKNSDHSNHDDKKANKLLPVTISEILDAGNFYIHLNDDKYAIDQLMNDLNSYPLPPPPIAFAPKVNDILIAKYSDKKWYRVKVVQNANPEYELFYVDYGIYQRVNIKDIRPIPPPFLKDPPFAKLCKLAYVDVPGAPGSRDNLDNSYADEADEFLHHLLWGKQLYASIEYKENDQVYVAIGDGKSLANVELVAAGLGVVKRRVRNPSSALVKKLQEEEEHARSTHQGLWVHGDFENDD